MISAGVSRGAGALLVVAAALLLLASGARAAASSSAGRAHTERSQAASASGAATAADSPPSAPTAAASIKELTASQFAELEAQTQGAGTGAAPSQSSVGGNPRAQDAIYTNQFVIQVAGGELEARQLAHKHGFVYLNHIIGDYYHLEHRRLARRSTSATGGPVGQLQESIGQEPQVSARDEQ